MTEQQNGNGCDICRAFRLLENGVVGQHLIAALGAADHVACDEVLKRVEARGIASGQGRERQCDHGFSLPWGCDIWGFLEPILNNRMVTKLPGLLGAGVVVGLDLASLATAVLDPMARDAEVSVIRRDDDG